MVSSSPRSPDTSPLDPQPFSSELRFAQYQLLIKSAELNSDRRERAHSFYTTINTSLLTLVAVIGGYGILSGDINGQPAKAAIAGFPFQAQAPIILAVSILGIFLCVLWRMHLNAFRRLSTAKFHVINAIEKDMPYRAFQAEWDELNKIGHAQLTAFERIVPLAGIVLYVAIFAIYAVLVTKLL